MIPFVKFSLVAAGTIAIAAGSFLMGKDHGELNERAKWQKKAAEQHVNIVKLNAQLAKQAEEHKKGIQKLETEHLVKLDESEKDKNRLHTEWRNRLDKLRNHIERNSSASTVPANAATSSVGNASGDDGRLAACGATLIDMAAERDELARTVALWQRWYKEVSL